MAVVRLILLLLLVVAAVLLLAGGVRAGPAFSLSRCWSNRRKRESNSVEPGVKCVRFSKMPTSSYGLDVFESGDRVCCYNGDREIAIVRHTWHVPTYYTDSKPIVCCNGFFTSQPVRRSGLAGVAVPDDGAVAASAGQPASRLEGTATLTDDAELAYVQRGDQREHAGQRWLFPVDGQAEDPRVDPVDAM